MTGTRQPVGPESFLDRLDAALRALGIEAAGAGRVCLAFSGGLDSTMLLNGLAKLGFGPRLEALHVDHGLQPESASWAARCIETAAALGLRCDVHRVDAGAEPGESPEAAARRARYRVFAERLGPADVVLTAHHGDDQLETILLRLLRGAGVRGLTGIHADTACGRGRLVRPLLGFSRDEIEREARAWRIEWLEDPSNRDTAFDRNYLRAHVTPLIKARWPSAHRLADRLARHMVEAEGLLEALAAADCAAFDDLGKVPVAGLLALDEARQTNALRHIARRLELDAPDSRQLAELRAALTTRPDAETRVAWPGAEAHIYRGHLYLMRGLAPPGPAAPGSRLRPGADWSGPAGCCELVPAEGPAIPDALAREGLEIRFRTGGERFRPSPGPHSKSLKHWFQEQGIVPWMRARIPLLYSGDWLVAVGDIELSADLPSDRHHGPFWKPRWTDHPRLR